MEVEITYNSSLIAINQSNATGHDSPFSQPIWVILTAIVCIIGIFSNFLVIFVIMCSTLKKSTFMNLLMSLAVFDIMYLSVLIISTIDIWDIIFSDTFLLYCHLKYFILWLTGIVSSWIAVLISLERYIAIYYPFKVHVYCTKKNTFITTLSLTILISIGLIPIFYANSVKIVDQRQICVFIVEDSTTVIFQCISNILACPVPFLFITFLNVRIITRLKAQTLFRLKSQREGSRQASSVNNKSLVAMMISVSFIFAVTSFPTTIVLIVQYSCTFIQGSSCLSNWIFELLLMLNNMNHSVNFFLYCLSGSVFRLALIKMFKCKKKTSSRSFVAPHISVAENVI